MLLFTNMTSPIGERVYYRSRYVIETAIYYTASRWRIGSSVIDTEFHSERELAEPNAARVAGSAGQRGERAKGRRNSELRTISSIPCVMLIVLTFVKSLSWEDEMW